MVETQHKSRFLADFLVFYSTRLSLQNTHLHLHLQQRNFRFQRTTISGFSSSGFHQRLEDLTELASPEIKRKKAPKRDGRGRRPAELPACLARQLRFGSAGPASLRPWKGMHCPRLLSLVFSSCLKHFGSVVWYAQKFRKTLWVSRMKVLPD